MIDTKEKEAFEQRIHDSQANPNLLLSDTRGMSLIAHAHFQAGEIEYGAAHYLMLNMCTAHIGKIVRFSDEVKLEGVLRPGTVAVSLPNTPAYGYSSTTNMLGIAIDLEQFNERMQCDYTADDLLPAATKLHNEPLLKSIMEAIWYDAELHGSTSAFFEHSIAVLLKHLVSTNIVKNSTYTYKLSTSKLNNVLEFIENRVCEGSDISVKEMATIANASPKNFSRSFCSQMGCTPYAYFTMRRMTLAQKLLQNKHLTITEIAHQLGYANASKFTALFKKTTGFTPRQWRLQ